MNSSLEKNGEPLLRSSPASRRAHVRRVCWGMCKKFYVYTVFPTTFELSSDLQRGTGGRARDPAAKDGEGMDRCRVCNYCCVRPQCSRCRGKSSFCHRFTCRGVCASDDFVCTLSSLRPHRGSRGTAQRVPGARPDSGFFLPGPLATGVSVFDTRPNPNLQSYDCTVFTSRVF